MKKLQDAMERILVPLATKLNGQRHVVAVRDAFTLTFPLTMAGSLVVLINNVLLSPEGFIAAIFKLDKLIPNLTDYQQILSPVIVGTTSIMALLISFLVAYELAKMLDGDAVLTGITSLAVFFILYPVSKPFINGGEGLDSTYFGAQGLFVALIVGLLVGEILTRVSRKKSLRISMPEMVPPAVSQSFNMLIPIIIMLAGAGLLNFFFASVIEGGLHILIYNTIQAPLTSLGSSMGTILAFTILQQFLWVLGIHGPNTLNALRSIIFAEQGLVNLEYVAKAGTAWGAPFPVYWQSINDAFGNTGGSGATLGLIIAILIAGKKNETQYQVAKMSLAPGIFNINETIIFGLPLVMNPIFVIPFIFTPVILNILGYILVAVLQVIPPVIYNVAWTTPGFLTPFLGSGADSILALVVGFVFLGISTLIYLPFVLANNKVGQENE